MPTDTGDPEKRVDLVFEGGGVKGIALAGAFSVLEEQGFRTQNVAGTSAGAVVGSLVAAGYSAKELYDILQETPFSSFQDEGWEDRIIGLGMPLSILKDHGIYEGKFFHGWLRERLAEKGISRFGDLKIAGETTLGGCTSFRSSFRTSHTINCYCCRVTRRCLGRIPTTSRSRMPCG